MPDDAEERVIECLAENPDDGISAFAMCTRLGIKFQPLSALLERLQSEGRARLVRRKNGAAFWFPDDKAPARTAPQPVEAPSPIAVSSTPAEQDPVTEDEGRVPCPVEGCTSMIKRKHKSVYTHLYGLHGLRGDKLHARLDEVLGADRLRHTPIGETARRPCPFPKCTSSFTGRHARSSLINHMVQIHKIGREEARGIADGKLAPPSAADMGTETEIVSTKPISEPITDPVDADIIPPSEVECEGCDQLHGGECERGEECVCNCATKMDQLEKSGPLICEWGPVPPEFLRPVGVVVESKEATDSLANGGTIMAKAIDDIDPGQNVTLAGAPADLTCDLDGDALCIKPPGFVDLQESDAMFVDLTDQQISELQGLIAATHRYEAMPRPAPCPDVRNTCTPLEVQHATIRATDRPQDEPSELSRLCSLAVEMEAAAKRNGYRIDVQIDTGGDIPLTVDVVKEGA